MIIDKFVAVLGLDVKRGEFERGQQTVGKLRGGLSKLAAVAGTAFAAFGTLSVAQDARRLDAYAKSVGLTATFLEHMGRAVGSLGFDFKHVSDIAEEMNNKIGESIGLEQITPVKEALQILGLEFDKISKMDRELQFRTILSAALDLEDAQAASSAIDILAGGESSKIISLLRSRGKSFDELIGGFERTDAQTKETREGLVKFAGAWAGLMGAIGTIKKALLGLIAHALTPILSSMAAITKSIAAFIHSGLEDYIWRIIAGIKILTATMGILWLFGKRAIFVGLIGQLATLGRIFAGGALAAGVGLFARLGVAFRAFLTLFTAGGIARALAALRGLFAGGGAAGRGFIRILMSGIRLIGAALVAILGIPGVIAGLAAVAVMAIQDMWTYFTDPEALTLTGLIIDDIKALWDDFKTWVGAFWEGLTISDIWVWVLDGIDGIIASAKQTWSDFRDWIVGLWDGFGLSIWSWVLDGADGMIASAKRTLSDFKNWIVGLWDGFALSIWSWVLDGVDGVIASAKQVWSDFKNWIVGLWDGFDLPIWGGVVDATVQTINQIKSLWTDFIAWFGSIGTDVGSFVCDAASGLVDSVNSAIDGFSKLFPVDIATPEVSAQTEPGIDVPSGSMLPQGLIPTAQTINNTSTSTSTSNAPVTKVDATINVDAGGMRADELSRYINEQLTEITGRSIGLTGEPAW